MMLSVIDLASGHRELWKRVPNATVRGQTSSSRRTTDAVAI